MSVFEKMLQEQNEVLKAFVAELNRDIDPEVIQKDAEKEEDR